jgi:hypothetical protein
MAFLHGLPVCEFIGHADHGGGKVLRWIGLTASIRRRANAMYTFGLVEGKTTEAYQRGKDT